MGDREFIEEPIRRDLELDLLNRIWQSADLKEEEATALAVGAQHTTRRARSLSGDLERGAP